MGNFVESPSTHRSVKARPTTAANPTRRPASPTTANLLTTLTPQQKQTLLERLTGTNNEEEADVARLWKAQATHAMDSSISELQLQQQIPALGHQYIPAIIRLCAKYNVSPHLVAEVIRQESAFKETAKSHAGAMGLMQLMPGTAQELGVKNPYDPEENLEGGIKYLAKILDMRDGDIPLTLASYNAGPYRKDIKAGQIPNIRETQHYVKAIMTKYEPRAEKTS